MSVTLKRVKVNGYKNLIDCDADFNDLNVLVGPNNSGKSNFLEIFTFVSVVLTGSDEVRKNIFEAARSPRGDSSICHLEDHICKPVSFLFSFDSTIEGVPVEIDYSLSIKCKDFMSTSDDDTDYLGFLSEELTYKEKNKPGKAVSLFNRNKNNLKIKTLKGSHSLHNIDSFTPAINTVNVFLADNYKFDKSLGVAIKVLLDISNVTIISASPNEIRNFIGKGKEYSYKSNYRTTAYDILPVIEEIDEDKLLFSQFKNTVCSVLDLEDVRYVKHKFPAKFKTKDSPEYIKWLSLKPHGQPHSEVTNFSDGTLMVLALLAILYCPSRVSKLVCIEEPENCLHPKALKTLITFLKAKSNDVQILITTHSPSLLNQIDPSNVIVARMHKDGGTRFERIKNIKELHRVLRKGYINFGDLLESEFKEDRAEIF